VGNNNSPTLKDTSEGAKRLVDKRRATTISVSQW
jgi:hypothetical protein